MPETLVHGPARKWRVLHTTCTRATSLALLLTGIVTTPGYAADEPLEEIMVTAQKRSERLQDVPVPVTALSASELSSNNQVRLQDYYSSVPGLNFTPSENGGADIAIRGITTGSSSAPNNPTIGYVIDDVPFGSSTALGGGRFFPDIDPSELQRIEVLRGPQGTLYGASSLGGLIKIVTVDPSTDRLSGRVQTDVNDVSHGHSPGYGARAAANVPLGDTFAVRMSGFTRRDAGYVDNLQSGQRDVNKGVADGGRLSALWSPNDTMSLKLSALIQRFDVEGYPQVDLDGGVRDLTQHQLPDTGWSHNRTQAYSAIAKAKLGSADLTFLSGYNVSSSTFNYDNTFQLGPQSLASFGFSGTPLIFYNKTKKFTEELRLQMPLGEKLEWLVGGFYTHESSDNLVNISTADDSGKIVGVQITQHYPTTYEESAAFTDLTVHFTDRFDTQFGARGSHITQGYNETDTGPGSLTANGFDPYVYQPLHLTASAFTYLVTPRFRVSDELMVYARFASGYRPGGPNANSNVTGVPDHFNPDKTQNYELGVKGNALGGTLSFDVSAYYIDWKDIQLNITDPNNSFFFYTANPGRAKSKGVELSLESKPITGLTLSGWVVWNDATLSKDFPAGGNLYGVKGDRLPDSSRLSGNLSLRQNFPLGAATAFAGASVSYIGRRQGLFIDSQHGTPTTARQDYPAYVTTDLRTGADYQDWTLTLYANNVTDRRGLLTGGVGGSNASLVGLIQPRTIGLSVARSF